MMPKLEILDLKTYYFVGPSIIKAVNGVYLKVNSGECIGIAGESGCGKSTLALSILKLVRPPGFIVGGKILFNGTDIIPLSFNEMQKLRWRKIAMVFQGALNALNPVYTIEEQIVEAITTHMKYGKSEARRKAGELLELVGLSRANLRNYPHELSGGMRQRALIAMALSCDPELLIADEPTTALDVVTQAQILMLLKDLQRQRNLTLIVISHDLSILAQICDRIAIMYAGKIVEEANIRDIFYKPAHPYTYALINAFPSVKGPKKGLFALSGEPPDMSKLPSGCCFHPRCPKVQKICYEVEPKLIEIDKEHYVACHLYT
ncbi:MAG: ABC transporter ATP-binding protein [Candidatus Bathyarchaeia archaeon]|nr:ABC transporter ATP-binding protein [Candidatus Bathyarchaeota archaeon]